MPHCDIDKPNMVRSWGPSKTTDHAGKVQRLWSAYTCKNCGGVVLAWALGANSEIAEMYPSRPIETFEFTGVPNVVAKDFQEALTCYSVLCFNAFAAMCRRTAQSILTNLGAKGKSRIKKQLEAAKALVPDRIDNATYEIFEQIIIHGADGAHPNLPELSPERASVLLELMKYVLNEVYVTKQKVNEAIVKRQEDISKM